ncbi:MAG TPA: hypothetical protein VK327_17805 [Candidatus Paceibacterota bacterium]|nr:hypothetical protein [Candidatus Paceibacterota bacterium]
MIAVVVIVQFFLVISFTGGAVNLAKVPYRQTERSLALQALSRDPSPENRAAFQHELQLASRYADRRQLARTGVVLAVVFGFEGMLIYLGKKHGGAERELDRLPSDTPGSGAEGLGNY